MSMPKNNVTAIKPTMEVSSLTLERVKELLNTWRLNKKNRNETIPQTLWEQIIGLLSQHTESEIRSALSLTVIQLNRGKQLVQAQPLLKEPSTSSALDSIDFCEAQDDTAYPLAYKPAEAFATNTSIVELYRPDGMLMKIHICTDRFEELLRAFFKG